MAGGAIYILSPTSYRVLESTFYGNAVVPATWASTISYALTLSTDKRAQAQIPVNAMYYCFVYPLRDSDHGALAEETTLAPEVHEYTRLVRFRVRSHHRARGTRVHYNTRPLRLSSR